ncbi:LacI family DNA-binding transcriptional regulator [Altericroceibacterium spongiae]|nr:LacI family DNA-binding transcriptional regulator [Altericroceibacterium spongiae]
MNRFVDMRVTMADVAREAGVSLKSVSRVVNGEAHVSASLREKVEHAVAQLGYVPHMAARSLAGNRSFTICLLFDNPSPNYKMKIQTGCYKACWEAGYQLRIEEIRPAETWDALEKQLLPVLHQRQSDGLVLTPPLADDPRVLDLIEKAGLPYVRIAPTADPGRSKAADMDDYAAAGDVARLFYAHGHRRHVAIINGPLAHGRSECRRQGFIETFQRLQPDISVMEEMGDFTFFSGIEAGKRLLARKPRPTAIFVTSDDMAAGVLNAAQQRGLNVPEDVSVCGYDDGIIAMTVWPYLTTIRQPIAEMAETGVRMLLDWADRDIVTRQIGYELIERDSVADASMA